MTQSNQFKKLVRVTIITTTTATEPLKGKEMWWKLYEWKHFLRCGMQLRIDEQRETVFFRMRVAKYTFFLYLHILCSVWYLIVDRKRSFYSNKSVVPEIGTMFFRFFYTQQNWPDKHFPPSLPYSTPPLKIRLFSLFYRPYRPQSMQFRLYRRSNIIISQLMLIQFGVNAWQ